MTNAAGSSACMNVGLQATLPMHKTASTTIFHQGRSTRCFPASTCLANSYQQCASHGITSIMAAVTVCWVGLCHTLGDPTPRYTASDTDMTSTPVTIIRNALSPSTAPRLARSPAMAPTSQ